MNKKVKTEGELRINDLEALNQFISFQVNEAIMCYILLDYVMMQFVPRKKTDQKVIFKNNPANTFFYRSINSHANSCLVSIEDNIRAIYDENRLKVNLDHYWHLVNHRDFISHPGTYNWSHKAMVSFTKENKGHLESRVPIIWKVKRSLEKKIYDIKGDVKHIENPIASLKYATLIHLILSDSLNEYYSAPSDDELLEGFSNYLDFYKKIYLN